MENAKAMKVHSSAIATMVTNSVKMIILYVSTLMNVLSLTMLHYAAGTHALTPSADTTATAETVSSSKTVFASTSTNANSKAPTAEKAPASTT